MVRRVGVIQKRFENTRKKGGAAAPSAPPLNLPMPLLTIIIETHRKVLTSLTLACTMLLAQVQILPLVFFLPRYKVNKGVVLAVLGLQSIVIKCIVAIFFPMGIQTVSISKWRTIGTKKK